MPILRSGGSTIHAPTPAPQIWDFELADGAAIVTTAINATDVRRASRWRGITSFFSFLGISTATSFTGLVGALWPSPIGDRPRTHSIAGTHHTIQINGDMSVGQVYDANGRPTGIQVSMTGVDDLGNPTGFTPLSERDALALGVLTGTSISTGSVIDTTLNTEEADTTTSGNEVTSPLDEPIPSTGDPALDELMDGTVRNPNTNEAHANQNLQTPVSKEEYEDGLREIAGKENVISHSGNGVEATLDDGTVIQTYPARRTDGLPGFTITNTDGVQTHHGSLTG